MVCIAIYYFIAILFATLDTARQLEDTAIETRRNTRKTTRNVLAEEQIDRPTESRKSSSSGSGSSDGRAMLQKALDLLAESRRETKRLQEALKEQIEMTKELKGVVAKQEEAMHETGKADSSDQGSDDRGAAASPRAARNYRYEYNGRTSAIIC
ncbi:hypothetical protein ACKAV7_013071 [Fusarium commune]